MVSEKEGPFSPRWNKAAVTFRVIAMKALGAHTQPRLCHNQLAQHYLAMPIHHTVVLWMHSRVNSLLGRGSPGYVPFPRYARARLHSRDNSSNLHIAARNTLHPISAAFRQ